MAAASDGLRPSLRPSGTNRAARPRSIRPCAATTAPSHSRERLSEFSKFSYRIQVRATYRLESDSYQASPRTQVTATSGLESDSYQAPTPTQVPATSGSVSSSYLGPIAALG